MQALEERPVEQVAAERRPLGARETALLRGIPDNGKVLELGPMMSPIAPRRDGWNVTVVDHATQQELIEKYRNDVHVDVTKIEQVDYVWRGGPLHESVPQALLGSFDVLIASHVIEHIPDPIRFLESARKLLHPERGVLSLAVPDKRWCFDALKPVSTTGQMLEAWRERRQRHSAATRFDASAYVAFDGGRSSWGREPLPALYLPDTLDHAFGEFRDWSGEPDAAYVDCHAWHFTPASFTLNLLELGACGMCDWHIDWLEPQPVVEFLTHLRPGTERFASAKERDARRLTLLKQIMVDLGEQISAQFAPAPSPVPEPVPLPVPVPGQISGQFDEQARQELHAIAETAAMLRSALRPSQAVWHGALPLRRAVARLRGRV